MNVKPKSEVRWKRVGLWAIITFASVAIVATAVTLRFHNIQWTRIIDAGEFHGLRIGQSHEEVVNSLRHWGVESVLPEVDYHEQVNHSNLWEIGKLRNWDGIYFTDDDGFSLRFEFAGDELVNVDGSVSGEEFLRATRIGQSKAEVIDVVRDLLRERHYTNAFNYLPDGDWVALSSMSKAEIANLRQFNTWQFYEPNSYSSAILRFDEGHLVRIEYTWTPFELP